MSETRQCTACNGAGFVVIAAGLAALEDRYSGLPVREMNERGWLGDVGDGEDVARCDAAFLHFWGVESHESVPVKRHSPPPAPTGEKEEGGT